MRVVSSFAEAQEPLLLPDTARWAKGWSCFSRCSAQISSKTAHLQLKSLAMLCSTHECANVLPRASQLPHGGRSTACLSGRGQAAACNRVTWRRLPSVKQMSFYENTRIGTIFSEVSVLFNMVRRSSTAYDNIAVFADLVTSAIPGRFWIPLANIQCRRCHSC